MNSTNIHPPVSNVPGNLQNVNAPIANMTPQRTRQPSRDKRSGYSARKWTGIIQGVCGIAAIVIAIIVLSVTYQDPRPSDYYAQFLLNQWTSRIWGLFTGAIFIFTGVLGLFSRKKEALITLYMLFSIGACLAACSGVINAGFGLSRNIQLKDYSLCRIPNSLTCCIRQNGYAWNPCGNSFYHNRYPHYQSYGSQLDQQVDYDSDECIEARISYDTCNDTNTKISKALIAFYILMILVHIIEGVTAIVGASSTCAGLDCCGTGTDTAPSRDIYYQTQQYPQGLEQGLPVTFIGQPSPPQYNQAMAFPPPAVTKENSSTIPLPRVL